jgi:hypothetical protein
MLKTERKHRLAHNAVVGLAAIAAGTVAIQWGWNTFAVEILGLPDIRFRHAVALELLVLAVPAPVALPRLFRRNAAG